MVRIIGLSVVSKLLRRVFNIHGYKGPREPRQGVWKVFREGGSLGENSEAPNRRTNQSLRDFTLLKVSLTELQKPREEGERSNSAEPPLATW